MVFPIAGGTQDTSYDITNSLMFNDDDSPKLSRSVSSSGSQRNATLSVWVKRGNFGTRQQIYSNKTASSGFSAMNVYFDTDNKLKIDHHDGSSNLSLYTNQRFKDPSAWYHIVHAIDTTTGTATNRLRLYINGTEITDFSTDNNPSQNADLELSSSTGDQSIGDDPRDSNDLFDGYMAEYNFVDGTTLDPTYFGKTDINGVWIPKKPDVSSYGTNGFFLEFKQTGTSQNSSGIGADTSGNDNHFAVTNLIDRYVATDTPTNNFAVLNTAANLQSGSVSQGNTKLVTHGGSSNNSLVPGTIGVQNGKWYVEVYFDSTNYPATGIMPDDTITDVRAGGGSNNSVYLGKSGSKSRFIRYDGQKSSSNSNSTYMAAVNGGDKVVQIALNMDDGQITFGANGQWGDGSGNTDETFANSTAAFTDINSSGDYTGHFTMFIFADENYGTSDTLLTNFGGCPPYGITGTVYSDANGYGKFKYEVPSGYYSVCTKNLAEFG